MKSDPTATDRALARFLLEPFYEMLGIDVPPDLTFGELLPDVDGDDPAAQHVRLLLLQLRHGLEARRQNGTLP